MKFIIFVIFLLVGNVAVKAQQTTLPDSAYFMQDSILIPTRSGIAISAKIVHKKGLQSPLPTLLFYTTYYQGKGDNIFGKRAADRDYVGVVALCSRHQNRPKTLCPL
jgi:uncharacterized protein